MAPYYQNRDAPLQCFNASSYCVTLDDYDRKCIAPTREGNRCSWTHAAADMDAIRSLMTRARASNHEQAAAVLEEVVRLRSCVRQHRRRLEASPAVWRDVTNMYVDQFAEAFPNRGLLTPPMTPPGVLSNTTVVFSAGPATIARYQLRSTGATQPALTFTPFPQDWDLTLDSVLKDDIPYDDPLTGFVYVFAWPSKPWKSPSSCRPRLSPNFRQQ
jgi:hypothetical protein